MKKLTLEFKVQLIDNDYYLICKDNEIDICLSELKRIFTIPTEIKKAWIVLSEKKLSKQSVKIIAPHCPCCVEIDGKRKNSFYRPKITNCDSESRLDRIWK